MISGEWSLKKEIENQTKNQVEYWPGEEGEVVGSKEVSVGTRERDFDSLLPGDPSINKTSLDTNNTLKNEPCFVCSFRWVLNGGPGGEGESSSNEKEKKTDLGSPVESQIEEKGGFVNSREGIVDSVNSVDSVDSADSADSVDSVDSVDSQPSKGDEEGEKNSSIVSGEDAIEIDDIDDAIEIKVDKNARLEVANGKKA